MPIIHKNLPNDELHEPKNIDTANQDDIYVADGNGSGNWGPAPVKGAYGGMQIVGNGTSVSLSSANDSTLRTDGDYVQLTTNWQGASGNNNITFNGDDVTIEKSGNYRVSFGACFKSDTNGSQIAFKYVLNDSSFAVRPVQTHASSSGIIYNVYYEGFITGLDVNDVIGVYVACDKSVNLTVVDANLLLTIVEG